MNIYSFKLEVFVAASVLLIIMILIEFNLIY